MNRDAAEMVFMIVTLSRCSIRDRMKTSTMIFDFGFVTMIGNNGNYI